MEKLLTAREVGDLLGFKTGWVLRKFEAGELPGFKLGGTSGPVRFKLSEIEAWLEAQHRGPEAQAA